MVIMFALFYEHYMINISFKMFKCEFLKTYVTYLGHLITHQVIQIDPNDKLKLCPIPLNVHQLHSFLGIFGFLQKFIRNYF